MTDRGPSGEAERLERLWSGAFGDAYVARNLGAHEHRAHFWLRLISEIRCRNVLEIGCNVGANLRWISEEVELAVGVDVNRNALGQLRLFAPRATGVAAQARQLPFGRGAFDLVFTMGVLIHQPDATLPVVMDEMVRCARRWILMAEYHSETSTEVPYRGEHGALFKRDYGRLFAERFPWFTARQAGFLGKDDGWDDITWWLFER